MPAGPRESLVWKLAALAQTIAHARQAASPLERRNTLGLAIHQIAELRTWLADEMEESPRQRILLIVTQLDRLIAEGLRPLRGIKGTPDVVFPETAFALPRRATGLGDDWPYETTIRVTVKNPTSIYIPDCSFVFPSADAYAVTSYLPAAVQLEPSAEQVVEISLAVKSDDELFPLQYSLHYVDSEEEQTSRDIRVVPQSRWKEIPNLYDPDPVKDRCHFMFTGRQKELQAIRRRVSSGGSVITFGMRRIGKTSLLYELRRMLSAAGCVVRYHDARYWQDEIQHNCVAEIEQIICRDILAHCAVDGTQRCENFTECLSIVGPPLREMQMKLIVILDEFDMILARGASLELSARQDPWAGLLARLGAIPAAASEVFSLIIAGHYRLATQPDYLTKYLWYLKDLLSVEVSMFSEEEAWDYAVRKVSPDFIQEHHGEIRKALESPEMEFGSLTFTGSAMALMDRLTGKHPYYLSLLCRALVDVMNDKKQGVVVKQDILDAIPIAASTDRHVESLWSGSDMATEQFQAPHKEILSYIIEHVGYERDVLTEQYVSISGGTAQLNQVVLKSVLDELVKFHVLDHERGRESYRFNIPLMGIILAKKIFAY